MELTLDVRAQIVRGWPPLKTVDVSRFVRTNVSQFGRFR